MKNFLRKFILLIAILIPSLSLANSDHAGFDYSITGGTQTYPLGGLLSLNTGYGWKMWEAEKSGEDLFWKYGYVRPILEIDTAAVLNRGALAIEVFPVSILGFTGGVGTSLRGSNYYQDFNCNDIQCNGQLNYQFVRAHLLMGYGKGVLSVKAKYEKFKASEDQMPFYEEMSYLVGSPGEDDLKSLTVLAGFKFNDMWNAGVMSIFQNFIHSENNNSSVFLAGNYTEGFWQASVGVGQYKSSHQNSNFSTVISVTYMGKKGLSLLD